MPYIDRINTDGITYDIQDSRNIYDLLYPVGSVYISSTNSNPSTNFGGTWELIEKQFKYRSVSYTNFSTIFTMNTTNVTGYASWGNVCWTPTTIEFRFAYTNKVNYATTTTYELFTFDPANLGVTRVDNLYFEGAVGTKIPAMHYAINGNDNKIELRGCTTQPTASQSCIICYSMPTRSEWRLDSACDKFYWKRTA